MAMQRQTWSVNGLSAELAMDRRTLSDRLDGLPPAETKQLKNRTEHRWYLADVLEHLENPNASRGIDEAIAGFKRLIGQELYPAVITSKHFGAIIANGVAEELGLTKEQGRRAYELACVALSYALAEALEDDGMEFLIPDGVMDKPTETAELERR